MTHTDRPILPAFARPASRCARRARRRTGTLARKGRRGAALLELSLALPVFLTMLLGILEVGSAFYVHHNMVLAAREAARQLAVRDGTVAEARQIASERLSDFSPKFTINVIEGVPDARDMTVEITVPRSEAAIGDPLGIMGSGLMRTRVTMRKEIE